MSGISGKTALVIPIEAIIKAPETGSINVFNKLADNITKSGLAEHRKEAYKHSLESLPQDLLLLHNNKSIDLESSLKNVTFTDANLKDEGFLSKASFLYKSFDNAFALAQEANISSVSSDSDKEELKKLRAICAEKLDPLNKAQSAIDERNTKIEIDKLGKIIEDLTILKNAPDNDVGRKQVSDIYSKDEYTKVTGHNPQDRDVKFILKDALKNSGHIKNLVTEELPFPLRDHSSDKDSEAAFNDKISSDALDRLINRLEFLKGKLDAGGKLGALGSDDFPKSDVTSASREYAGYDITDSSSAASSTKGNYTLRFLNDMKFEHIFAPATPTLATAATTPAAISAAATQAPTHTPTPTPSAAVATPAAASAATIASAASAAATVPTQTPTPNPSAPHPTTTSAAAISSPTRSAAATITSAVSAAVSAVTPTASAVPSSAATAKSPSPAPSGSGGAASSSAAPSPDRQPDQNQPDQNNQPGQTGGIWSKMLAELIKMLIEALAKAFGKDLPEGWKEGFDSAWNQYNNGLNQSSGMGNNSSANVMRDFFDWHNNNTTGPTSPFGLVISSLEPSRERIMNMALGGADAARKENPNADFPAVLSGALHPLTADVNNTDAQNVVAAVPTYNAQKSADMQAAQATLASTAPVAMAASGSLTPSPAKPDPTAPWGEELGELYKKLHDLDREQGNAPSQQLRNAYEERMEELLNELYGPRGTPKALRDADRDAGLKTPAGVDENFSNKLNDAVAEKREQTTTASEQAPRSNGALEELKETIIAANTPAPRSEVPSPAAAAQVGNSSSHSMSPRPSPSPS